MAKTSSPTQQLIDAEEIRDGVIVLKNGGLRQIIMVQGVNFDLKSEEEQGLILYGFQNILNALDFSLQFFIHSRKINIDNYLSRLTAKQEEETSELLKKQIGEYREFIRSLVAENPIMQKTFFTIVPFDPIVLPKAVAGIASRVMGIFGKKTAATEEEKQRKIGQGLAQLRQRTDQIISGLNAIGLAAAPLDTESTIQLFYNLYNPETIERKLNVDAQ